MKNKIRAVMLSLLLVIGGGGVAVATAAPAQAASYNVSSCHYHTGWIYAWASYKVQYCFRSYNANSWYKMAHDGWYARDCDPYCQPYWQKTNHYRQSNGAF